MNIRDKADNAPGITLLILFIFSLLYRLWIIALVPQPFIFDQTEYENYAGRIYDSANLLAANTFRSYLYPLFLAVIYKLSFFGNHELVTYVQAILDSFVSIFVFIIMRDGLKSGKWSWAGAILYAVNPFTAAFTGVLLSESITLFLVGAMTVSGIMYLKTGKPIYAFLLGFTSGCIGQARNQVLIFSVVPFAALFSLNRFRIKLQTAMLIAAGFILTIIYPLYVNWREYREITFSTVDNILIREFYNGTVVGLHRPFRSEFPTRATWMWAQYNSELFPGITKEDREMLDKKYTTITINNIIEDPVGYIDMRLYKMWFVWQKEAIYAYKEPGFVQHSIVTYLLNVSLLILMCYGFARWTVNKSDNTALWLKRTMIWSVIVATVAYSFTNAEQRYTIPLYPYVMVGAALGVRKLAEVYQRRKTYRINS